MDRFSRQISSNLPQLFGGKTIKKPLAFPWSSKSVKARWITEQFCVVLGYFTSFNQMSTLLNRKAFVIIFLCFCSLNTCWCKKKRPVSSKEKKKKKLTLTEFISSHFFIFWYCKFGTNLPTLVSFILYKLPYDDFSPKGELIILRIQKALWWITSCLPSNLIIHLVGKYQLHQHKGVCYRQVATHPMTACLGGANVLRKQELRLCWAVIAPIICFYTYKKDKE